MKKYKKKSEEEFDQILFDSNDVEPQKANDNEAIEEEEKFNPNGLENVIDRITHGLVGTLCIEDGVMNKPLFRQGDYVHFITPAKLEKKDIILYRSNEEFFVRRIIKFDNEDIYVAGDNEREYHIAHREDVVGKAIGRQRKKKYLSFSLKNNQKFYLFRKVNLAKLRLGNRVMNYDDDMSQESFEIAMQNLDATQQTTTTEVKPTYNTAGIDLDSELADFLNPDDLVREIKSQNVQVEDEEFEADDENSAAEEIIDYIDNEDAESEENSDSNDEESEEEIEEEKDEEDE